MGGSAGLGNVAWLGPGTGHVLSRERERGGEGLNPLVKDGFICTGSYEKFKHSSKNRFLFNCPYFWCGCSLCLYPPSK